MKPFFFRTYTKFGKAPVGWMTQLNSRNTYNHLNIRFDKVCLSYDRITHILRVSMCGL